jgi:hypothetical protein
VTEPVFFTVECDLRAVVADVASDADYDGQLAPVSATAVFTPQINRGDLILATNATPRPIGYIPASVTAVVDGADGRLKLRTTTDAGATGGFTFAPVRLLANSALLELDPDTPLIYRVEFTQVTFFGRPGVIKPIFFEAPTTDVTINLIESGFSQPGQPPTGITKIAPTGVRFVNDTLVFSFAGVDLAEPLPLSEITGPQGDAATITVGTVTTGDPGDPATVTNTGTTSEAVFDFDIPKGAAATITVGDVTTVAPDQPATVTNTGTTAEAVFDFDVPQGDKGDAATITVGTVTTLSPGDDATVTNTGDSSAAVLDFGLPEGIQGATGPKGDAATIAVGNVTTLSPGASATVTNTGTSGAAVFQFGLPQGQTGLTGATGPTGPTGLKGDAASLAIGTITTVSPTSPASVTNIGTSSAAVLNFSIPKGDTGVNGSADWADILNKPAAIAAGATEAAARDSIDAEYTGNRGVALGYAALDAAGKVPYSQLPASLMSYIGTWSAATNTPTLSNGTGDTGDTYRVTASGTVNLGSGSIEFTTGDYIIMNQAGVWEKSDGTDSVSSVAGKTGTVTLAKADVGLSDVNNTSDLAKPVSTATQTALDGKEPTITAGSSGQYWTGNKTFATLDKSAVGLGNVDNTTDVNKPISTATQTALDAKQATITAGTTSQFYRGDKTFQTLNAAAVGLGNVDNTADAAKTVSSAATLSTSRTFQTNLGSGTAVGFNGSANVTPGVTGTLTVANGGSGATTLTGVLKGNGTGAFTAATAGTDYLVPSSASRLVVTTATGDVGTENGANTWAKIATISFGTNQFFETQVMLSVVGGSSGAHDSAIISVFARSLATSSNPVVDVQMLAKGGAQSLIMPDSFKIISGGWGTDIELWMRKRLGYGVFNVYELSRSAASVGSNAIIYNNGAAWQSATPTGAVNNVSTNGVNRGAPRVSTVTSSATPTINLNDTDQFNITALATAITSFSVAGTLIDGQKLLVRIKDNGTARTIAWGASFVASGAAALPTTTVASKTHLVGFIYDSVNARFVCVASDSAGY